MNDRFKFRIYDLEQKHYLRVIQDETTGAEGFAAFYGEYNNICKPMSFFLCHNIDRWVVEQCTGLKDKNGNLIYESDYVKDKDGDIYLVKWDAELVQFNATGKDNCGFETITPFMKGETETLEICGNIHEQPGQGRTK